jgi:hypothetical protein
MANTGLYRPYAGPFGLDALAARHKNHVNTDVNASTLDGGARPSQGVVLLSRSQ